MKIIFTRFFFILIVSLSSFNNIWSQNDSKTDSVELISFSPSSCDDKYLVEAIRNRISRIDFKSDTIFIEVALIENCAFGMEDVLGFAHIVNDTLYLDYMQKSEFEAKQDGDYYFPLIASCDCCFEFKYVITGIIKDITPPICINGAYLTYHPSKFNDRFYDIPIDSISHSDSLNSLDYFGYRQGKWIWNQNGRLKADFEYHDNEITQGQWFDYFSNGEIKEKYRWYSQDSVIFREYDTKGILITKRNVRFNDNGFGEYEFIFTKEEIDSLKTKHNNGYSK